jgi:two-component sensor histidine kinase
MLYQSQDYARVPFSKFATELTSRVLSASGMLATAITLQLEMLELLLPVDKAIPCGLILNELMANILKHAFRGRSSGTILVGLRRSEAGDIVLTVSDDGVGIAPEFEPATSKSLGVQLVVTLVEQLEGSLRIVRERGTRFEITFPL